MSCYEWESGSLIIPSDQWVGLRKSIIQRFNAQQDDRFEKAKALHAAMKEAAKGHRGAHRNKAMHEARQDFCRPLDHVERYAVERHVWWEGKLVTPKKKDYAHLPLSKDARIDCGELTVTLRNADRMLTWSVDENNHARESADDSWLGKFVLRKLGRIDWKRGTGGVFTGNDEYNRENTDAGGGSNYITRSFGPLGEKERKRGW